MGILTQNPPRATLCGFESGLRHQHFKIVTRLTPRKEARLEVAL